jgi:DNA-binding MarR family transcriptional regulator
MLEVERITLCRMIDRLSEAALVERRADPQDRRVWRLHLMPKARNIVSQLNEIGAEIEEEALSEITPAERAMLRETLQRVREGLQPGDRDGKGKRASTGGAA